MKQVQIREEMEKMGIKFQEDGSPYPEDDQVAKVVSLYTLIEGFMMSLMREGHIQFTPQHGSALAGPADDFLKDWIQEAAEEYFFG